MRKFIEIQFFDELNDFVSNENNNIKFRHFYIDNPSIKDTIESLGVPHTEIELILVNGISKDFDYLINSEDVINVYPNLKNIPNNQHSFVKPILPKVKKFIVDANIGKLARLLRMLGFDTYFENHIDDKVLVDIAKERNLIILTRDIGVLKRKDAKYGYWVRETDPYKQLQEVVVKYDLLEDINPLTICLECNNKLKIVDKDKIINKLEPKTKELFNEFFYCENCEKVYWKGSHYQNMLNSIENIQK